MMTDEQLANETVEERRARWLSVGASGAALPTRRPAVGQELNRTKKWETEHDAYRTLRKAGHQPQTVADAPADLARLGG